MLGFNLYILEIRMWFSELEKLVLNSAGCYRIPTFVSFLKVSAIWCWFVLALVTCTQKFRGAFPSMIATKTRRCSRIGSYFFLCMNYCSDESVRGVVAGFFRADFCLFSWFFFVQLKRDSGRIFQCKCMERTSILPFSFLVGNHACMHSRFWKQLAFGCFITLHGQLN